MSTLDRTVAPEIRHFDRVSGKARDAERHAALYHRSGK